MTKLTRRMIRWAKDCSRLETSVSLSSSLSSWGWLGDEEEASPPKNHLTKRWWTGIGERHFWEPVDSGASDDDGPDIQGKGDVNVNNRFNQSKPIDNSIKTLLTNIYTQKNIVGKNCQLLMDTI